MKLKEELKKQTKESVYKMYCSLVYDKKSYEHLTREKMINAIIRECNQESYIYYLCTEKELVFLKKYHDKKIKPTNFFQYQWEIEQLSKKCIFSKTNCVVFEEQQKNVEKALEILKNNPLHKTNDDQLSLCIIGFIKTNGSISIHTLISTFLKITNMNQEELVHYLSHPLIHFYCDRKKDENTSYDEIIYYRDYAYLLNELSEKRKSIQEEKTFKLSDMYDIFYFGFPIQNPTVKKMYDMIKELPEKTFLLKLIEDARILNNREFFPRFINDSKILQSIHEALDEMPCAVFSGITPNTYRKKKLNGKSLQQALEITPQANAHLSKKDAIQFYKLYFALLEYTNNTYKINENIKKIYKRTEKIKPKELVKIDAYLWKHKEILKQFIELNPYNFNEEELTIISKFKSALSSSFVLIGYDREYTKLLSNDGKIYMIKGIHGNIDKIINSSKIPTCISTTLLMYNNVIIYNSHFEEQPFSSKENILDLTKKATHFYHL